MNNRDTQFTGFAHALAEEILLEMEYSVGRASQDISANLEVLLARRAYDFAFHAIENSRSNDMEDWETDAIMPYVPDMPELPKDQEWNSEEVRKSLKELLFPEDSK